VAQAGSDTSRSPAGTRLAQPAADVARTWVRERHAGAVVSGTTVQLAHRVVAARDRPPLAFGAMARPSPRTEAIRSGVVEYGLVRHRVVEALRKGKVLREDVCDAHPELLRAAQHVGVPTEHPCPICDAPSTAEVTYVFGARLPSGGTCPGSRAELSRLERREEPVICFAVEACTACGFHHLARKWQAGGRPARASKRA